MTTILLLSISLAVLTLAGCSNRAIYDNVQLHNRNACGKVPQPEYQECLESADKSYQEYQRERDELLER